MPAELGGGGLDHVTQALAEMGSLPSGPVSISVHRPAPILLACQGEQRERYLLPTVRGERRDCLALTEPEAGSDVRWMKNTARRDGGDWVIDGTKHFISHADLADFAIVLSPSPAANETQRGPQAADHLLPGRPRHARLRDPAAATERVAPRLPQLHAHLRRLPRARRKILGERGPGLRAA